MEVAESARGPHRVDLVLDHDLLDHPLLLLSLQTDQVHAHLAADVPRVQPAGLRGARDSTGVGEYSSDALLQVG